MKLNLYLILLVTIIQSQIVIMVSQTIFYQSIFQGGITSDGFTTTLGSGSGLFNVSLNSSSTINKAFLFCGRHGNAEAIEINFEGNQILFDDNNIISEHFTSPFYASINGKGSVHCVDVTNYINPTLNSYSISIPNQNFTNIRYSDFYLVIAYENITLSKVNLTIAINNENIGQFMNFEILNINKISTQNDVGFAVHGGYMCDTVTEPTLVFLNTTFLGKLGGNDYNTSSICGGVVGSFLYENNILSGLGDDNPNWQMAGSDGLSNISSLITNNYVSLSSTFEVQSSSTINYATNPIWSVHLTYTTPCDTFSTALTDNIDVCKGTQGQLNATGGIAYEWLPQVGLSCYNCPNPIVTADSIHHYTCRIWNTDSCSKVLPVKINILPLPIMPTIVVNPTLCSGNTGHIHITNQPAAYTYTLDAGTPQNTLHFYNQTAGNHTLQIATNNGCSIDTLLTVAEVNNVVAQFTASPTSGDVPLSVNFTNQSTNANNYIWYIENDTLNTTQANHTFDTSGVFTVTLVAYNNFPQCSDTAQVTIVAEYPFTIIAPSLYVSDENYTPYQIYTSGVKELHYELFTDQGKLVYNKILFPNAGTISLWNSTQLAKGIYLYRIWAMDEDGVEKVITGKVVVI